MALQLHEKNNENIMKQRKKEGKPQIAYVGIDRVK